jgi:membrane-associated protease RseP (regulator of RpoE activity)
MDSRGCLVLFTMVAALPLAGVSACQEAPAPDGRTAQTVTVPFEMLPSNHMMMEAKLNGEGPFRLIFDLGSPVILLGNRAAEASGAIPKDAPKSFLFGVRGEGTIDRLEVGGLEARDLPVVVMDHPTVKALASMLGKPLDGIIGYTFFARYRTTIDYKARELTFTPVDSEVGNLLEDLPARLLGPKVQKSRTVAAAGLWGLTVGGADAGRGGVPITRVVAGSPAAEAGLQPGDILTAIDGRWTTEPDEAYDAAADAPPGQAVPVTILRDGQERQLRVTPRDGI